MIETLVLSLLYFFLELLIVICMCWLIAVFLLINLKNHYGKHIKDIDDWNNRCDKTVEDARRRNPYDDTIRRYHTAQYDPQKKHDYDEACMYLDIIFPFKIKWNTLLDRMTYALFLCLCWLLLLGIFTVLQKYFHHTQNKYKYEQVGGYIDILLFRFKK